ncbi:MAG: S1C family serine protease [Gemmatimonadaceae bacterium]
MRTRTLSLVLFAAGVACGAGVGAADRDSVQPAFAAQAVAVPTAALTSLEQVYMKVARDVSPAVVSVGVEGGSGSGFFIRRDGVLLTNAHVVRNAARVEVGLADGRRLPGRVLGADPGMDVAVVKVDLTDAPVVPAGNSDALQVGQITIAIGNPFGLDRTLTTGVVSAVNRSPRGVQFGGLIQTDAAINPGNSGGPLLDSDGRVVGINSAIFSSSGSSAGVGFAIPINLAQDVANQLLTTGRIRYAVLGVAPVDIYPQLVEALRLPVSEGIIIQFVDQGSPAARVGLTINDIITRIDDQPVTSSGDLRRLLRERKPGDTVTLSLVRPPDGRRETVQVRLGEQVVR